MASTLTSKGQVTVPKHIRDALQLLPGTEVEFAVNAEGEVVVRRHRPVRQARRPAKDRFEAVRGQADIRWKTED